MSKKLAFTPSPGERVSALDHVYYEIQQLALLFHARLIPFGLPFNNARIEATVIHLRNALHFFEHESNKRTQDDVLAEDYGFRRSRLPVDSQTRERMNKEMAHLSYGRLQRTQTERRWDFDAVVRPVLERAGEFVQHLLTDKQYVADAERCKQWEELARLIAMVLARPGDKAPEGGA